MKNVKINGPEDLTEENLTAFRENIREIRNSHKQQKSLLEHDPKLYFNSLEECIEYYGYNAEPFEDFIERIEKQYRYENIK